MNASRSSNVIGLVVNGRGEWYEKLLNAFELHGRTWLQRTAPINKKFLKTFNDEISREGFFHVFGYVQKSHHSIEYLIKASEIRQFDDKQPPPDESAPVFSQYDIDQGKCENGELSYKAYIKIISIEKIPQIPPSHFQNINTNKPLDHRYMKAPHFYVSHELKANSTQIAYPSRSSFLKPCEEEIRQNKSKLLNGEIISIHLSEQGYNRDCQITISSADSKHFTTDWTGTDTTRFSARIKATALALYNEKCFDSYKVSHQSGLLTIQQAQPAPILFKKVTQSQFTDGVRINKDFHKYFNSPESTRFVEKGTSTTITVNFNSKDFTAKYLHENPTKVDREMQSIRFSQELKDEFQAVFAGQKGYFSIELGDSVEKFVFKVIRDSDPTDEESFGKRFIKQDYNNLDEASIAKKRRDYLKKHTDTQTVPQRKSTSNRNSIHSDAVLKEHVKQLYQYHCQICSEQIKKIGWHEGLTTTQEIEYLSADAHHVTPLGVGGLDVPSNIICVCPNCHRKLHTGEVVIEFSHDGPACRNQITGEKLLMTIDSDHSLVIRTA